MAGLSLFSAAPRRLEGKVALITGAASGIGERTARLFTKHGAKLIIADIQVDSGHSLAKELDGPTSASFLHCDVTNETDVKNAVDFAISKHGKLDIMFNNAGIAGSHVPSIWDMDKAKFEEIISTNLVGPFLGTKHAARTMIPARQGSIITTASVCSVLGGLSNHAYTASKHGVVGFMKNAAVELGQYGIRVNCVSPSGVQTPLLRNFLKAKDDEELLKIVPQSFICGGDAVAEAAVYLGSDESKYVSGHNLVVDRGLTIVNNGFCIFN